MKASDLSDAQLLDELWRRWRPDIDLANIKYGVFIHEGETSEIYIATLDDVQGPHITPLNWKGAALIAMNLRLCAVNLIEMQDGVSHNEAFEKLSGYEGDLIEQGAQNE